MSLQVMKYTFKGRNDFTSDFQNKREIDCGIHYLNPNFNTIIGIYENKDNINSMYLSPLNQNVQIVKVILLNPAVIIVAMIKIVE